jgi:endonuclease-3 related protein
MVGAILTQNTNWRNVSKAIENIKRAKLLSPKELLANRKKIPQLIRPSGFYKLKAKRLITFLQYYVDKYDGCERNLNLVKTEKIRRELLGISGIGYETCDSILLYALQRPIFVVDAYTRRIFSRHNLIQIDFSYEEIRRKFEASLPRDTRLYNEYHALLVRLGKEICRKNEPVCSHCPIRNI